ncbi:hypothetical protein E4U09_000804 [Claviceps aff. purpurea]|uniref:JmjC domain-containing protein n=1 Tax=Claviceps aff. purpurea TaxID=1967640 RepID=A0A9P7QKA1_9HYPO|nr:hypothetical protein E4U09_000804 [Claviceps aff. purpurea]
MPAASPRNNILPSTLVNEPTTSSCVVRGLSLQTLLSWYRDATQKLITSTHDTQQTFPHGSDGTGESAAANDLLTRQAASLLRLHDSLLDTDEETRVSLAAPLVDQRLEDLASISMSKLYAYRYDLVPYHWRQIYTDTLILRTYHDILCREAPTGASWLQPDTLDSIVENLDRALITAGNAGVLGRQWIEKTLTLLEELDSQVHQRVKQDTTAPEKSESQPRKRVRIGKNTTAGNATRCVLLPTHEPYGRPAPLSEEKSCPRYESWSLMRFERYMNAETPPRPIIFTDLVSSWPALTDRPWKSREYLLSRTFGGRRLVPVEIGRSYVDETWGQELMSFRKFLSKYVVGDAVPPPPPPPPPPPAPAPSTGPTSGPSCESPAVVPAAAVAAEHAGDVVGEVGYLAQHNLFQQIPSLRNDVSIPDFCWSTVRGYPTGGDDAGVGAKEPPPLEEPLLNAWFGPARTITPLHTDGYHNLLVQVVGTKYVRLYAPWARGMRPRGVENGVDMSNTSALDVGLLEGWDEGPEGDTKTDEEEMRRVRSELEDAEYWECILGEGDTLLIPMGWWHYVRSLSVSFSVSFWWN